jgi:anthranilate phosphoribosyltransferase
MDNTREIKQIAAQLLSGLLANPHVYASISDEGVKGQQEQELMIMAIAMAESLIVKIDEKLNVL